MKFKRSEAFGEVIWVLIEEPRSSQTASDGFSGKAHATVSTPIGSPDNVRCKITDRLPLALPTTLKDFELGMPVTSSSSIEFWILDVGRFTTPFIRLLSLSGVEVSVLLPGPRRSVRAVRYRS